MTDYIAREIETDDLINESIRQRERMTVLPDDLNDIPIEQAVAEMHKISAGIHEALGRGDD